MTNETEAGETQPLEDIYMAQREELMSLLRTCVKTNEPLRVHQKIALMPDEMSVVLQKIRNGYGFSRKERTALTEAGFLLDKMFPEA